MMSDAASPEDVVNFTKARAAAAHALLVLGNLWP
jgi:hypothetical protein